MPKSFIRRISRSHLAVAFSLLAFVLAVFSPLPITITYAHAAEGDKHLGWSEKPNYLFVGKEHTSDKYVAYCVNFPWVGPPPRNQSRVLYNESTDLANALTTPVSEDKGKEIHEKLRAILYHGHARNGSHFKETLEETIGTRNIDSTFYETTQWAVWHYTNNFDPRTYKKHYYETAPHAIKTQLNAQFGIYDKLINTEKLSTVPEKFNVQLYTSSMRNPRGYRYQNLLSTWDSARPPAKKGRQDASIKILKITKEDGKIKNKTLTGAEFKLYYGEGEDELLRTHTVKDKGTGELVDSLWEIKLAELANEFPDLDIKMGTAFTLVESKAPEGYQKLDKPITFRIQPDQGHEDETSFANYHVEVRDTAGQWKPVEQIAIPANDEKLKVASDRSVQYLLVDNKKIVTEKPAPKPEKPTPKPAPKPTPKPEKPAPKPEKPGKDHSDSRKELSHTGATAVVALSVSAVAALTAGGVLLLLRRRKLAGK
ncbi:MAG: thioester-forming surface-anchored protein [Actinomycetaceae bacterium]|nr:thioester-forming surface-anchored protein [Actinomycetaceae bacterium]